MLAVMTGKPGQGKTSLLTYFLVNDYATHKREIVANYNLKFPYRQLTDRDLEQLLAGEQELNNVSLGLDEIWLLMDSRLSATDQNLFMSYLYLQSRKMNVDIYGTAQSFGQIDKRFRKNTDYVIECEKKGDSIFWTSYDMDALKNGTCIPKKHITNMKAIWDLFDTRQIMKPFRLNKKKKE